MIKYRVSTLEDNIKQDIADIKRMLDLYKGRMEHESTPFIGGLPGTPLFNCSGGKTVIAEIMDRFNYYEKERVAKDDELYPFKSNYDTPREIEPLSEWSKKNLLPNIEYDIDKNNIVAEYHYEYGVHPLEIPQTELITINQLALIGVLKRYPELFERAFSKIDRKDKLFIYDVAYYNLCNDGKNKYFSSRCDDYEKEYIDDEAIIDIVLEKLEKTTKLKLEKG